jgi:hypothetical protein
VLGTRYEKSPGYRRKLLLEGQFRPFSRRYTLAGVSRPDDRSHRTLVYGSLTAVLALVYFCRIVVLQRVLVVLTGRESTLAVVASTLLIAALFSPLRRTIQSFIDRRFYRRKYDARKTLKAFSTQLRKETDLDALSDELVSVVRDHAT